MPPTINEDIQDLVIAHQHYVERYKTFEVRKLHTFLNKADREIRSVLLDADITNWTRRRQEKMLETITEIQRTHTKQFQAAGIQDLKLFGAAEASSTAGIINKAAGDLISLTTLSLEIPGQSAIWAAANASPMLLDDGTAVTLKSFLKRTGQRRLGIIEDTLRYGFFTGESSAQIARKLVGTATNPGTLQVSRRSAEIFARTSLNHMSSVSRQQTYNANSDLVSGYEWISTLDTRTTDICQYRDGRVWFFDARARDATDKPLLDGELYPPAHIGCRSSTAPLTKSWRQLGIKARDVPPAMRASANGVVPASQTYTEWITKQPAAAQRDVLGATRYKLYKNGTFKVDQFYGKDGRFLTLDQLIKKAS